MKLRVIISILTAFVVVNSITELCSQTVFRKFYWGDRILEKSYGHSSYPPYDIDTTIIIGYHLPFKLPIDLQEKAIQICGVFKTSKDTFPQEIAIYNQADMDGFYIKWNDKAHISRVYEHPTGLDFILSDDKVVSIIKHSSVSKNYFNIEIDNYNLKITTELEKVKHTYIISLTGSFIKEEKKKDNNLDYLMLWSKL